MAIGAKAEGTVEVLLKTVGFQGLHQQTNKVFKGMSGRQSYYLGMMQSRMGYAMLGMSAAIAGLGVVAVKSFAGFDQAMKNTASVTNATAEQIDILAEVAKELGTIGTASATDVASAMYFLGSAGYDVREIFESIQPVMYLAVATQTDMADTARILMQTLKAFGKEAQEATHFAEVFAAGISSSQLRMEWLGSSMKHLGPVAHEVGMSIEETVAALAMLHDVGIQAGMAGRHLRRMIQGTIKDTDKAKETLAKYGLTLEDISIKEHGFAKVMETLREKNAQLVDIFALFGLRASASAAALVRNAKAFEEYLENVQDGTALMRMFNTQMEGLQAQFIKLKNTFTVLLYQVITPLIPTIRIVVEELTKFIKRLSQLPQWVHILMGITAIVSALGLAFLGVNFILAGMLTQGMMSFGLIKAAIVATFVMTKKLTVAMIRLVAVKLINALMGWKYQTNQLGLAMANIKRMKFHTVVNKISLSIGVLITRLAAIIIPLVLIGALLIVSVTAWKRWRDSIVPFIDSVKKRVINLQSIVRDFVINVSAWLDKLKMPAWMERVAEIFEKIGNIFIKGTKKFAQEHKVTIGAIKSATGDLVDDLKDATMDIGHFFKDIFDKLKGMIPTDILDDFRDRLNEMFPEWEQTADDTADAFSDMTDEIEEDINFLGEKFESFTLSLEHNFSASIFQLIKGSKSWLDVWNDICDNALMSFINGFVNGMVESFGKALWDMHNMQAGWGSGIWGQLASWGASLLGGFGGVPGAVGSIWSGASNMNSLTGVAPSFAKGTDYIPEDMLAYLHKGEAVVPANDNKQQELTIVNVIDPSFVNASIAKDPNTIVNIINNDVVMAGSTRKTMRRYLK